MNPTNRAYKTVSIPKELYNTTKLIVDTSPQYTSVSEFVKESIRDKIKDVLKTQQNVKRIQF